MYEAKKFVMSLEGAATGGVVFAVVTFSVGHLGESNRDAAEDKVVGDGIIRDKSAMKKY